MSIKKVTHILKPHLIDFKGRFQPTKLLTKKLNIIIRKDKTKSDFPSFLHGAVGLVAPSTWIKGIKKNKFIIWLGLPENIMKRHLIPTIATAEGHLSQERSNLQSTKNKKDKQKPEPKIKNDDDFFPHSNFPNVKTCEVLYFLTTFND